MQLEIIVLCGFAFLTGFVDSIAGGGGLIQLPAMLLFLGHLPLPTVLGTNKLAAIVGTGTAAVQYSRRVQINWKLIVPMALAAFSFSMIGARVVSGMRPETMRPLIILLLLGIATYIFFKKDFGEHEQPSLSTRRQIVYGLAAGMAIGFYDGFFGPGTGTFLIFAFISVFGLSFLLASASAKLINVATNLAAIIYFVATGHILLYLAIPMGVFNILGAIAGSRMAILKGNRFVRVLFLVVVSLMIAKLSYDTFLPYL